MTDTSTQPEEERAESTGDTEYVTGNEGLTDKLYTVKYKTDTQSHLQAKDVEVCRSCKDKPCIPRCCAEVYSWEDDHLHIAFENCLECGVCKVICPYDNIDWSYPRGGFGVVYKFG